MTSRHCGDGSAATLRTALHRSRCPLAGGRLVRSRAAKVVQRRNGAGIGVCARAPAQAAIRGNGLARLHIAAIRGNVSRSYDHLLDLGGSASARRRAAFLCHWCLPRQNRQPEPVVFLRMTLLRPSVDPHISRRSHNPFLHSRSRCWWRTSHRSHCLSRECGRYRCDPQIIGIVDIHRLQAPSFWTLWPLWLLRLFKWLGRWLPFRGLLRFRS